MEYFFRLTKIYIYFVEKLIHFISLQEKDSDRDKLQEVLEENANLQLSNKNSMSESATLVAQLDKLKTKAGVVNGASFSSDLIGKFITSNLINLMPSIA